VCIQPKFLSNFGSILLDLLVILLNPTNQPGYKPEMGTDFVISKVQTKDMRRFGGENYVFNGKYQGTTFI